MNLIDGGFYESAQLRDDRGQFGIRVVAPKRTEFVEQDGHLTPVEDRVAVWIYKSQAARTWVLTDDRLGAARVPPSFALPHAMLVLDLHADWHRFCVAG
jgi:hypothetical protein